MNNKNGTRRKKQTYTRSPGSGRQEGEEEKDHKMRMKTDVQKDSSEDVDAEEGKRKKKGCEKKEGKRRREEENDTLRSSC